MSSILRRHKLASEFSAPDDFVFASNKGTALNPSNVRNRGLQPALKAAGRYPLPGHSDALARRIREYRTHNLIVGGTADLLWQTGFRGTGQVLEIKGADHSLEVADWRTSVQQHEAVASAVADFASGVAG